MTRRLALLLGSVSAGVLLLVLLLPDCVWLERTAEWDGTPLMQAAYNGDVETVEMLLAKSGADVNATICKTKDTALHKASLRGNLEVVRLLIAAGANVNAPGGGAGPEKDVGPVLHAAIDNDCSKILAILRKQGVIGQSHCGDLRVLELPAYKLQQKRFERRRLEMVKALVEAGADVNIRGLWSGSTPLIAATADRTALIAKYLIEQGADVDAQNKEGMTALMFAAIKGSSAAVEITEMLLENGANHLIKNYRGKNALDIARENGHEEIIRILERLEN